MKAPFLLLGMLLVLCNGCSDDLDPKSLVTRPRIVALRAEVVGDTDRSSPAPSEQVDVTLNVVEVGASLLGQWNFIACVPEPNVFEAPICEVGGDVLCDGCIGTLPALPDPILRLTVPDASDLGEADSILLIGVYCAGGATASPEDLMAITTGDATTVSPCADDANDGEFLATRIPLQVGISTNENPRIVRAMLSGGVWTDVAPIDAADTDCGTTGITQRAAGAPPLVLSIEVDPLSFEEFVISSDGPDMGETATESLLVSWHITDGDIARSFSFLEVGEGEVAMNAWLPPETVPPEGKLVRFTMVLRDRDERSAGRGGADWVERALCICPNTGCEPL